MKTCDYESALHHPEIKTYWFGGEDIFLCAIHAEWLFAGLAPKEDK